MSTDYYISTAQVEFFQQQGYVGPLECHSPFLSQLPALVADRGSCSRGIEGPIPHPDHWAETDVKHINVHNPHLVDDELLAICAHPSIVAPVSQLLGSEDVMLFHSRLRVKFPGRPDRVPWHQDVGKYDGGVYADGSPIPSVTAWIAIDEVELERGPVSVIPGTHGKLYGDWRKGFHSGVGSQLEVEGLDVRKAVALPAGAMKFYLFHSWTMHNSLDNVSDKPRVALVMRFVHPRDAIMEDFDYISLNLPSR